MKSAAATIIGVSLLASSLGCAICDSSLDNNFASYGGIIERTDPQHGRVGSSIYPASATVGTIGSVTPGEPASRAIDRPRDLQPNDGDNDDGGFKPLDPSENSSPNEVNPSNQSIDEILDSIPNLDDQQYRDLLEQIPGDDSSDSFPGEVNAIPLKDLVESDSSIQLASLAETENDDVVVLFEPVATTSIMKQLGDVITGE
jgi:hypothetical protein